MAFVSLIPFGLAAATTQSPRQLVLVAAIAGWAFAATTLDFFRTADTFSNGALDGPMAPIWLIGSLIAGLAWSVAALASRWLHLNRQWPWALALPAGWLTSEWVRDAVFRSAIGGGCPWLQLGLSQADSAPLRSLASLGGAPLVTFVVCLVNGAAIDLFQSATRRRVVSKPLLTFALLSVTALTVSTPILGVSRAPFGESTSVKVRLTTLDAQSAPPSAADVTIFPEISWPHPIHVDGQGRVVDTYENARLSSLPQRLQTDVVIGVIRRDSPSRDDPRRRNAAAILRRDGSCVAFSDKRSRAPFLEFVPRFFNWPLVRDWLRRRGLPKEDFTSASMEARWSPLDRDRFGFAVMICYDVADATKVRAAVLGRPREDPAVAMIFIGNEADDHSGVGGRFLHAMTRFRASELGVPALRVARGGTASVILPDGRILTEQFDGRASCDLTGHVLPAESAVRTTFALIGDWVHPLLALAMIMSLSRSAWRRHKIIQNRRLP